MGVLNPDMLRGLVDAAVAAGLGNQRNELLALVDADIVSNLRRSDTEKGQLYLDLGALSALTVEADGSGPLKTWLDTALGLVAQQHPTRRVFEGALELLLTRAMQPAGEPSADPLEARIVQVSVPVIDRENLRTNLKLLIEEQLPSTLLVTGPPDSGRSTTADFVQWYAGLLEQPVCRVPDATTYDPFELVSLQLEPVLAPPGSVHRTASLAQPYKHRELSALVRNWILEQRTPCWILLDDLDPLKDQPTHPLVDFMSALAVMLSSGTPSRFARLLLLGWPLPEDPKGVPAGAVRRETLAYDQIGRDHVEKFVRCLYREKLGEETLLDAVLNETVARILPADEVVGAARLLWIGQRAFEEVEARLGGGA